MDLDRRSFVTLAALFGASLAWAGPARASRSGWKERRDLFPEGVASGDPDHRSVFLWTRRPFEQDQAQVLRVEVALDEAFSRVVARTPLRVSSAADWTARVLVAGLRPATTYWYRFVDRDGNGSRIGRTRTAPHPDDKRPVKFAFVSCQSINEGKLNGYRRMIFEDERTPQSEQLGFVLHLGDFIYEVVQYPEEGAKRFDRTIYEVARIPDGGKTGKLHFPLTIEGYRAVYRGYLADPDLQDARARWPFVAIWDNHEFSWQGWQSVVKAGDAGRPGQSVKIAANQAWFEYIPARVRAPSGSLEQFGPPRVENVKIDRWDENGLGIEPNNLIAINSLRAYRALRYGRHLDLIITDQYSHRSENPFTDPSLDKLGGDEFLGMSPEDLLQILDGGRAYRNGNPPAQVSFGKASVPNPRRESPVQTLLGVEQKAWFKQRLRDSRATWKVWGSSLGGPDFRSDPHNLPPGLTKEPWPSTAYASLGGGDWSTAYAERSEIYATVREAGITGFAIVAGDQHSFWAGYATAELPPGRFDPVGVSFVGASLSSPGTMEAYEHRFPKNNPLAPLFIINPGPSGRPEWTYNMLLRHGVKSCLDYAQNFDRKRAQSLSNPDLSPHLKFVDAGGHGYATVRLSAEEMRTEFVCIPRPITRSESPDGGPLRYRIEHVAKLWAKGERPQLIQRVIEGDPGLGI